MRRAEWPGRAGRALKRVSEGGVPANLADLQADHGVNRRERARSTQPVPSFGWREPTKDLSLVTCVATRVAVPRATDTDDCGGGAASLSAVPAPKMVRL